MWLLYLSLQNTYGSKSLKLLTEMFLPKVLFHFGKWLSLLWQCKFWKKRFIPDSVNWISIFHIFRKLLSTSNHSLAISLWYSSYVQTLKNPLHAYTNSRTASDLTQQINQPILFREQQPITRLRTKASNYDQIYSCQNSNKTE